MDEEKKSVILYTEWAQPLKALSLEDKGRIFDAILSYSISIHAPREGSDAVEQRTDPSGGKISIHAPREGSDPGAAAPPWLAI